MKKKLNNKGFSLVELIIVIAIMAVLVAVLAPQYIKYVERSRVSTDVSNLDSVISAVKIAAADPTDSLAVSTYTLNVTNGVVDLTNLTTNVTNALGMTSLTLKSDGAKTAAGTKITITIAATTYAVSCSLTYSGTAWNNSAT